MEYAYEYDYDEGQVAPERYQFSFIPSTYIYIFFIHFSEHLNTAIQLLGCND